MTRGRLYLAMLAAWVALTFTLTSIPNPEFGPSFPGADKVAHFGFYGVVGFLFVLWRRELGTGAAVAVVWAAIFAAAPGRRRRDSPAVDPGPVDGAPRLGGRLRGRDGGGLLLGRGGFDAPVPPHAETIRPFPAPSRIESSFILAFDMRFRYVVAFEALNILGGAT